MTMDAQDYALLAAVAEGLALDSRPYRVLGNSLGMAEEEVIARLRKLKELNIIARFGVIVRHHELGYRANAMVAWDIPDNEVEQCGHAIADYPFVTLCYRRRRAPPVWPYNLFCMIHGKERGTVKEQLAQLRQREGLALYPYTVLFSRRRFKQRGARYDRVDAPRSWDGLAR
tara:strand:- start:61 stop:576 length:516 start_codon:yes stop_codon:yes gene_type:complete